MVKFWKITLLCFSFLIMLCVLILLNSAKIIDAFAMSYAVTVTAFLGVDVAKMITTTAGMPKWQFEEIDLYKYIMVFSFNAILFGFGLYKINYYMVDISNSVSAFGTSCMGVIALILAGIGGNSIATKVDGGQQ